VTGVQTCALPIWFETHFGLAVRTHEKKFASWPLAGRGKRWEKDEHDMRRLVENPNPAVATVLDRYARLSDEELANPGGKRTVRTAWNLGIIVAGLLAGTGAVGGVAGLPG